MPFQNVAGLTWFNTRQDEFSINPLLLSHRRSPYDRPSSALRRSDPRGPSHGRSRERRPSRARRAAPRRVRGVPLGVRLPRARRRPHAHDLRHLPPGAGRGRPRRGGCDAGRLHPSGAPGVVDPGRPLPRRLALPGGAVGGAQREARGGPSAAARDRLRAGPGEGECHVARHVTLAGGSARPGRRHCRPARHAAVGDRPAVFRGAARRQKFLEATRKTEQARDDNQ
jgi:hypothetical protein